MKTGMITVQDVSCNGSMGCGDWRDLSATH
jgi:hypothetical protein